jgi:hypothetical protein
MEATRKKIAKIRKYKGDDKYSWALFIDGRVVYSGMSRSEATWRRDRYIREGKL